jgi:hypothetical protein
MPMKTWPRPRIMVALWSLLATVSFVGWLIRGGITLGLLTLASASIAVGLARGAGPRRSTSKR